MKKKIGILLLISLLLLSFYFPAIAISQPTSYKDSRKIKPLSDPSEAVWYNLDEIDAANPEHPLHDKLPKRVMPNETPEPGDHYCFGGELKTGYSITGAFSKQEIHDDLELGTGDDRTLYAPTITCPAPCPVESVTAYWRYSGYSQTYIAWGVWDFSTGSWKKFIYHNGNFDDFVDYEAGIGDIYFTDIYKSGSTWYVYLWNFTADTWQEMYSTTASVPDRGTDFGWNLWESITWDSNWPDLPEIRSVNTMVHISGSWYFLTSSYGGDEYDNLPGSFDEGYGWVNNRKYYDWWVG